MERQSDVIREVTALVEAACYADSNVFGESIWTHHLLSVIHYGRRLAPELNADPELVELGALLHDLSAIRDSSLAEEHHLHSATLAQDILSDMGYPQTKIDIVKDAIRNHRGSVPGELTTPEAVTLASADAMAHIANVPSLLHLTYAERGMRVDEGVEWVRAKLQRSWNKLCPEAQTMIHDRYDAALLILETRTNEGTS